jgi:hypothetical protein
VQDDGLQEPVLLQVADELAELGLSTSSSGKRSAAGWESRSAGGEAGGGSVEYSIGALAFRGCPRTRRRTARVENDGVWIPSEAR